MIVQKKVKKKSKSKSWWRNCHIWWPTGGCIPDWCPDIPCPSCPTITCPSCPTLTCPSCPSCPMCTLPTWCTTCPPKCCTECPPKCWTECWFCPQCVVYVVLFRITSLNSLTTHSNTDTAGKCATSRTYSKSVTRVSAWDPC